MTSFTAKATRLLRTRIETVLPSTLLPLGVPDVAGLVGLKVRVKDLDNGDLVILSGIIPTLVSPH